MLKEILISMRPKQWYKNLILFAGLIFSLNLFNINMLLSVVFAFVLFCLLSGGEYIVNDILDIKKDKKHPKKSKRPIAAGKLNKHFALIFAIISFIFVFIGAHLINKEFLFISITYFVLILIYSLFLKDLIIVDVLTISIGFVIRAIAGALTIKVSISPWLIICTFLIALFLVLGKRRHELIILKSNAKNHRKNLKNYSIEMLDHMINISATLLIISYSLYTFLSNNLYMMLTIPFAIYGIFRYLFLIHKKNFGGEVELLFKDKGIIISLFLWIITIIILLYLNLL